MNVKTRCRICVKSCRRYPKNGVYDVKEISDAQIIKDTNEHPKANRKILIFDDLVNACGKV